MNLVYVLQNNFELNDAWLEQSRDSSVEEYDT
jgi:hypothetical protein